MTVTYEYLRRGEPTGRYVWVDEPEDIDSTQTIRRRNAASQIKRMDESRKWQRVEDSIPQEIQPYVIGSMDSPKQPSQRDQLAPFQEPVKRANESGDERETKAPTQADVRAWAQDQGIEVNQQGRVPNDLIRRYLEAQED